MSGMETFGVRRLGSLCGGVYVFYISLPPILQPHRQLLVTAGSPWHVLAYRYIRPLSHGVLPGGLCLNFSILAGAVVTGSGPTLSPCELAYICKDSVSIETTVYPGSPGWYDMLVGMDIVITCIYYFIFC